MAGTIFFLTRDCDLRGEIVTALSQAGFAVMHTADYPEALLKLEKVKPHLAIMDDDLSTMESMEVYYRLHQELGAFVVILGDDPSCEGWVKVNEIQADSYIKKPLGCRELVARVEAIFRRRCKREGEVLGYV